MSVILFFLFFLSHFCKLVRKKLRCAFLCSRLFCVCVQMCMHAHHHVRIYLCMCVCTCACVCVCVHAWVDAIMCACVCHKDKCCTEIAQVTFQVQKYIQFWLSCRGLISIWILQFISLHCYQSLFSLLTCILKQEPYSTIMFPCINLHGHFQGYITLALV